MPGWQRNEQLINGRSKERDWWEKASIVSGFLSSVVLAVVGLAITLSIDNAQIESSKANTKAQIISSETSARAQLHAAEEKARSDKRLQEGQLTAQLVQNLADRDPIRRRVALVALGESVPSDICDKILKIVASGEPDKQLRSTAIEQLGLSKNGSAVAVLNGIATDSHRSADERLLAKSSQSRIAVTSSIGANTFVFAASADAAFVSPELGHGDFTYCLLRGLDGGANPNSPGKVTVGDMVAYATREVPALSQGKQVPIFDISGSPETPMICESATHGNVVGLYIGVAKNKYSMAAALFADNDANSFSEEVKKLCSGNACFFTLLVNEQATRSSVIDALNRLKSRIGSDTVLVVYYSGHAKLDEQGRGEWIPYDGDPNHDLTNISIDEIKSFLSESTAKTKFLFMDACFTGTKHLAHSDIAR